MARITGLDTLRKEYHATLCRELLAIRDGVVNIADRGSTTSVAIARALCLKLGVGGATASKSAQTLGKEFADHTAAFLRAAFVRLDHLRPGPWLFATQPNEANIDRFAQYAHLADVQRVLNENPALKASLGGDYLITPDIVVFRFPLEDKTLDPTGRFLDPRSRVARRTPLRRDNTSDAAPMLLASISMKWTMRSDRSQNTRTEALNLLRNRKGAAPHIAVVTLEPMPTRIASIAMGTGDVDCTYHAALDELREALVEAQLADQLEVLDTLVDGRRLRDISDLPYDLAM
jgi:hypothetical protein